MKPQNILDAMNDIDFDMVADAMVEDAMLKAPPKQATLLWLRYAIAAACIIMSTALNIFAAPIGINGGLPSRNDPPVTGFPEDFQLEIEYGSCISLYRSTEEVRYTYISDNESVASVYGNGLIMGKGEGNTVITVIAENKYGKAQTEIPVRVVDYNPLRTELTQRTKFLPQIGTLAWRNHLIFDNSQYNIRGTELKEGGPVMIVDNTLCLCIAVSTEQLTNIDPSDCRNISFDVYYGLRSDNYAIYKKVTLSPSSVFQEGAIALYYTKFHDDLRDDIAENAQYWSTIVMCVDGNPIAMSSTDDLKWTDSCMTQIEYALAHPDEIEK